MNILLSTFFRTSQPDNLNAKALHELLLYYLRERFHKEKKNTELRHLVVTNLHEWFIFDAQLFEKLFAQNKELVRQFTDFEEGRSGARNTDFFYREIAAPVIAANQAEMAFAHFDIRHYEKAARNANPTDDNQLIALYKLLSPQHLLKLPFANDSNTLDRGFYAELLHLIGLTEAKEGGKKLIGRPAPEKRHSGSLLENTITQLDSHDKISRLLNPRQFGETYQERLYNVALELVITWVNRLLFLKLLEAQLLSYHNRNADYTFLNTNRIKSFDDLDGLFFQVLARRPEDRTPEASRLFGRVPYLNSSLFEPTELEHQTLFIGNLRDERELPTLPGTVLKEATGRKRSGSLPTLAYFFDFLNAYDFSSEGSEDIQEDNKTLINASVLGLIFEKINGYKDGSFFTPGFITMYMCRETIRRAVVQKFNEAYAWNCRSFDELKEDLNTEIRTASQGRKAVRQQANAVVNSLRICDPAVGSGHFLVSALNELISLKGELHILADAAFEPLSDYRMQVVNDELIVADLDNKLFEYKPGNPQSQRIQETLFHEKQTLIENCLFGVDINPNSVKICRLRLWIELLKNAYYKTPAELETLPNIDINIKTGNSLISRFALDADLKQALKKSKWNISTYRNAVSSYHNATSKEQKRDLGQLINGIKSDFRTEIDKNDPKLKRLQRLEQELYLKYGGALFSEKLTKAQRSLRDKLQTEAEKLRAQVEEIKSNRLYENAFEWRFEFPEVLNEDGDFVGFDVVIGNPPYIRSREFLTDEEKKYFIANYKTISYQIDFYKIFIEKGLSILSNNGKLCYITPSVFLANEYDKVLRGFILKNYSVELIIKPNDQIFEEANVSVTIFLLEGKKQHSQVELLEIENQTFITKAFANQSQFEKEGFVINTNFDKSEFSIIDKMNRFKSLEDHFEVVNGIKVRK